MKLSTHNLDQFFDLSRVDLFDPHFFATGDPHAVWHFLRSQAPILAQRLDDGREFWSVTRHEDVCRVLKDYNAFTSEQGTMLCILHKPDIAAGKMMAATDPSRHSELRKPFERVLGQSALQAHMPRLSRVVSDMLAPGMSGNTWDFAEAALFFPIDFIGTLMGIPTSDRKELVRLTTMSIAADDPEFMDGTAEETLRFAHHELLAYFASEVSRRHRTGSKDDLIGQLMTMNVGGKKLSDEEIMFNCYGLLLGANVTTPHAASATVLAMAENPDEYNRWAASPDLLASGVEEGLRWSSPAVHFMRYAKQDTELQGTTIKRGEAVVAWLGSANRDERVFENPYRFDVGRHPNRHVAFGFGPHFCVGAWVARFALRTLFSEIMRRVERIELAGPVDHLASNFVAGIKHLPVRMIPR